ncbi:MAG: hypothetical protein HW416_598 [Chloroflexi bacterium]|nr:hypothetical protein [Chloroflexota bacterium]
MSQRWGLSSLGIAVALGAFVSMACSQPGGPTVATPTTAELPPAGVESFAVASANHVEANVSYAQTPPVGGEHWPAWQNCGFYASAIPSEAAVHSLEHGAVWITFQPNLPQTQLDKIRQLAKNDGYVLASPYPGLPSPVVASAWGRQLRLDSADDARLGQFVKFFRQGPTAPERAPCSGAVGTPDP